MFNDILKYWDSLLEISNPIYDNNEYTYRALLESSKRNRTIIPKSLDVILYDFPFLDQFGKSKLRPAMVLMYKGELFAVMISSTEGKGDKIHRDYNYIIRDWKSIGLHEQSYVVCGTRVPFERIRNHGYIGRFPNVEANEVISRITKFYDEGVFNRPEQFMSWLISNKVKDTWHPSGNNNENALQTLRDIKESHRANCVDIATAVREICIRSNIVHWVIQISFHNEAGNKGYGHVFVIYKGKKGLHVFKYIDRSSEHTTPIASIELHKGERNLENVIQKEVDFLRPHSEYMLGEKGYPKITILNRKELELYDACVARKDTQREFLEQLDILEKSQVESYGTFKYEWGQIILEQKSDSKDTPFTEKYIFEIGVYPNIVER